MLRVIDLDPVLQRLLASEAPQGEILGAAYLLAQDLVEDLLTYGIERSRLEAFTIESLSPHAKA